MCFVTQHEARVIVTQSRRLKNEDDIHDGYLLIIPKGALIIPNLKSLIHHASSKPKITHQNQILVRICPGRLLVDTSVFLSCVMTLAVFDITPFMENGKAVMPDLDQRTGLISHPQTQKFKCQITPKSPNALALINAESL